MHLIRLEDVSEIKGLSAGSASDVNRAQGPQFSVGGQEVQGSGRGPVRLKHDVVCAHLRCESSRSEHEIKDML